MADTFARSLAHWSEDHRSGMDAFYTLATEDYRHLALSHPWRDVFETLQGRVGARSLRLLDVACGSGKFPTALVRHGGLDEAAIRPVTADLLDPSAFSLREAAAALAAPFTSGRSFETTLQAFEPADPYDIVWATHALYAVPRAEMGAAMKRFLAALGDGMGFIAHATAEAHYLRFYEAFLADRPGAGVPYSPAHALTDALRTHGASFVTQDITYANEAPDSARDAVEGFLQRCVFDDSVSLDELTEGAATGPYLANCRTDDGWRFDQRVRLIFINPVDGA